MIERTSYYTRNNSVTKLSSLPLDDTVVTYVISIGNWNLRDESIVTNDERFVN